MRIIYDNKIKKNKLNLIRNFTCKNLDDYSKIIYYDKCIISIININYIFNCKRYSLNSNTEVKSYIFNLYSKYKCKRFIKYVSWYRYIDKQQSRKTYYFISG